MQKLKVQKQTPISSKNAEKQKSNKMNIVVH